MENKKNLESQLLADNIGLVVAQAKKFKPTNVTDLDDYKQAGYLGLLKAIRKYNPNIGTKLITFAWNAIYREIAREAGKFNEKQEKLIEEPAEYKNDKIWEYVPKLSDNDFFILWMRVCGYTIQEIADSIKESKQSICIKLQKIINKIKECNEQAEKNISSRRS